MAAVPWRCGEVSLRHGPACGGRDPGARRGTGAGPRTGPGARTGRHAHPQRGRAPVRLGQLVGARTRLASLGRRALPRPRPRPLLPLFEAGVGIDVVHPSADLSPYKLLVLPGHYLLSAENAERIRAFVADGGSLLASFFTGIVDEHDRVHTGGCPAPMGDVLGVRVEEFWPAAVDEAVPLRAPAGDAPEPAPAPASLWREDVKLTGARAELFFAGPDWDDDRPAVTVHTHGAGTARYLATRPDPVAMRAVVDRSLADAGVAPVLPGLHTGVQATIRHGADHDVLILLNHTDDTHEVTLPADRRDLLDDRRPLVRHVALEPRGVAVLGSVLTSTPSPRRAL
ncbi:beta-galactosidase trimerization domain-containing protein [Streptomyces sp. NPDC048258]|uniref:beta-galactosidase n=1 Tax=Streptomyces sp. NPDC048258 TaxID=3365527 RepID=UPI00371DB07B